MKDPKRECVEAEGPPAPQRRRVQFAADVEIAGEGIPTELGSSAAEASRKGSPRVTSAGRPRAPAEGEGLSEAEMLESKFTKEKVRPAASLGCLSTCKQQQQQQLGVSIGGLASRERHSPAG